MTLVQGEQLRVPERVILAPAVGVFRPLLPEPNGAGANDASGNGASGRAAEGNGVSGHAAEGTPPEGKMVAKGDVVGVIETGGRSLPVRSHFTGLLMGMLADPGERVREGQPVAWLRVV